MARILIATYCIQQPDNSFAKTEVFYNTGLLANGGEPIEEVTNAAISCSYFTVPVGTYLEDFCATASGVGIRRTIRFANFGTARYWNAVDTTDNACNGTCDLSTIYSAGLPTSTTTSRDGKIRLDVTTSYPPISAYLTGVGAPTSNILSTTAGVLPATYIIRYDNLVANSYVVQLQDANNCLFNTTSITVAAGPASGTGTPGLPSNIDWFKYEMVGSVATTNTGFAATLVVQGYAWNKTTKQVYAVAPIPVNYPEFNEQTIRYAEGDIVKYTIRILLSTYTTYYRAKAELIAANFIGTGKIPLPTDDVYWYPLYVANKSTLWLDTPTRTDGTEYDYFYSPPPTNNINYYFYDPGTIVRYGWAGFYRAKYKVTSRTLTGRIPAPVPGMSTAEWEPVDFYSDFYYAIPETQAIDQYSVGGINRSVRYHAYDPEQPAYTPASTSSQRVTWGPVSPAQGDDFVLIDDTTPAVENELGELKVLDIIKNDIDDAGAENGSVAILATSPSLPIRYHMRNGVRAGYVQDNTSGIYENLPAGSYTVDVYDALTPTNRTTSITFEITDSYAMRWRLRFDNPKSTALELRVFERNWIGAVTDVTGTDEPVILSWDSGGSPDGYLPEAIGAELQFSVLTSIAKQFVSTIEKDDRNHRIDYYVAGDLKFRGYINTTLYTEAMVRATGNKVTLTALDGIGQLKSTKFINHKQEPDRPEQVGRTNMLSVILKILSFTDVNIPLYTSVNLRDVLMNANADPLAMAFIQRNAFNKTDKKALSYPDLPEASDVLYGILKLFNAVLFQADGAWRIISLNEVYDLTAATRVWSPAGVLQAAPAAPATVRILDSVSATASNEMFWINGSQQRTIVAGAQIVKATVKPQLESNLLLNGDFTEWSGTGVGAYPSYWSKQGNPGLLRSKGEKAGEYSVLFSSYTTTFTASNYLLSPPIPHLNGQDEDVIELKFRAVMEPTTVNPAVLSATIYFQVVADGTPVNQPITFEIKTGDKWKDYSAYLPLGIVANEVRVRLITPVAANAASVASTIRFNSVALSIAPNGQDWSDVSLLHKDVVNNNVTSLRLDDVELTYADMPRVANIAGNEVQGKKMDLYAWRHAISVQDPAHPNQFLPTSSWKRGTVGAGTTLLENAAQDRLAMRTVPAVVWNGEVKGNGVKLLRVGMMLDMLDEDGRFIVTTCYKNERTGTARISVRKLADGDFGDLQPILPDGARIAYKNSRLGYRVAFVNGVEGYRIAEYGSSSDTILQYFDNDYVDDGYVVD